MADIRNGRRVAQVRLLAGSCTLLIALLLAFGPRAPQWQNGWVLLGVYWLVAFGLWLASRMHDRAARWSSLALPLLDMPLVFYYAMHQRQVVSNPAALASFILGIFVFLVFQSVLTLDQRQIRMAGFIAVALEIFLLRSVGADGGILLVAAGLLVITASSGEYLSRGVLRLMSDHTAKQVLANRLGRTFSPQVAALLESRGQDRMPGEARDVTVLFSDIRGFTQISERLSPAAVVAMLDEYLEVMSATIFSFAGTVDKFTGDGILANYGAPVEQPDRAQHIERLTRDCSRVDPAGGPSAKLARASRQSNSASIGEACAGRSPPFHPAR